MTPEDFTAAAQILRGPVSALATQLTDGGRKHVVAIALCENTQPHDGPCPECRILETRYSGVARHLVRILDARPQLADLYDAAAAFVAEHPDLGRPHVDGQPCDDHACRIVTGLRELARTLTGDRPTAAPSAAAPDAPLHAHEVTPADAAAIRMPTGAQFGPEATVTLPSGKTITGAEMARWLDSEAAGEQR
ncbi:hypothetical protein [Acrocarpospora sp. B8E8]|uniref:hypothetical protein n=1 Tax=Acrocarpospora sp. B8E8 TaxID=3153572 RepID=UPI00325E44C3